MTTRSLKRAAPSVKAHHRVSGPNTGKNSGRRHISKIINGLFKLISGWDVYLQCRGQSKSLCFTHHDVICQLTHIPSFKGLRIFLYISQDRK